MFNILSILAKGCSVRVSALLSLLSLAIAIGLAPRMDAAEPGAAAPGTPDVIKVSVMQGMFKGLPDVLVKAGGDQFGDMFKTFIGLPGAVEAEADHAALAKKLKDGKVHLGVFHGFEWAWLKKDYPDLAPLLITIPPHLPQASIVVNAKAPYMGPQDLKGADVDIPFNMKAHGYLYGEKLEKSTPGAFKLVQSENASMDELLDELGKANGKVKAVLVDGGSFAGYQNNNPGKATQVKVLCQCDPLPQTVLIYNTKTIPAKTAKQIQDGLLAAKNNPKGKVFLFMWHLKGFEPANAAFDELVAKSLVAFPAPQKK